MPQRKIVEVVDHFYRQAVWVPVFENAVEIFIVTVTHLLVEKLGSILPGNIDKAAGCKLPGIDHIYIEEIYIVVGIELSGTDLGEVAVITKVEELRILHLAPVVTRPEVD